MFKRVLSNLCDWEVNISNSCIGSSIVLSNLCDWEVSAKFFGAFKLVLSNLCDWEDSETDEDSKVFRFKQSMRLGSYSDVTGMRVDSVLSNLCDWEDSGGSFNKSSSVVLSNLCDWEGSLLR